MINNLFVSVFRRFKLLAHGNGNGLYRMNKSKNTISEDYDYYFDLSDRKYLHYGDVLFFIPLALILAKCKKVTIIIDEGREGFLSALIPRKSKIKITSGAYNFSPRCIVITSPYKLFDYKKTTHCLIVGLGLPDKNLKIKYPEYIAQTFINEVLGETISLAYIENFIKEWLIEVKENISKKNIYNPQKGIFLCPYIASGRFRDFFGFKRRALLKRAARLSADNDIHVYLIGGRDDSDICKKLFSQRVHDVRGMDILSVMQLACSENIVIGLGFDNFWMHFFDMIGKPFEVKFRGRFLSTSRNNHFNSVNLSFTYFTEKTYL